MTSNNSTRKDFNTLRTIKTIHKSKNVKQQIPAKLVPREGFITVWSRKTGLPMQVPTDPHVRSLVRFVRRVGALCEVSAQNGWSFHFLTLSRRGLQRIVKPFSGSFLPWLNGRFGKHKKAYVWYAGRRHIHALIACPAGLLPLQINLNPPRTKPKFRLASTGKLVSITELRRTWRKHSGASTVNIAAPYKRVRDIKKYLVENFEEEANKRSHKRDTNRWSSSQLGWRAYEKTYKEALDELASAGLLVSVVRKGRKVEATLADGTKKTIESEFTVIPPEQWKENISATEAAWRAEQQK